MNQRQTHKGTILVVDDCPLTIALMRSVLEKDGYDFIVATDGLSAINLAAARKPDLIMLDVLMPGINGYETCKRLREQPATRDTPVIFLSALTETRDKITGFELGAVDYVTKPVDAAELLARVQTHLTLHDLRRNLRDLNRTLEDRVRERTLSLAEANASLKEEIQEHRRTETQLREKREHLKEAQQIARIGHWEVDHASGRLVWSDEIYRIFGVDPEQSPSYQLYLDRIHPKDRFLINDGYEDAVWNRTPCGATFRVIRPDGAIRHIHQKCRTDCDAAGKPLRTIGTCQDITDRIQMEEENRQLTQRLMQAQKLEAIGTLAGGIAHDFNNILASIIGYTEISKIRHAEGDDVDESLDAALKACVRARDLVRHIQTFSRQVEMETQPVTVNNIVKECLAFLKASAPADIEIRSSVETSPGVVLGDPTQIHQIMMNLCTNAVHAMKEKGGVLDVRLDKITLENGGEPLSGLTAGEYVRLTVSDTGSGIPDETLERIFDPFFTTKPYGEGTGMGLSIIHGIVEKMGGAVSVSSEVGKGTVFEVALPRYDRRARDRLSEGPVVKKGSGRILLVDDETGILQSNRQLLELFGYAVVTAADGETALRLFSEDPDSYDLVLTDLEMPKLSGLDLSKRLLEIRSDTPVVLSTGFSADVTPEMIQASGIREIIQKPMTAGELSELLHTVLDFEKTN